MHEKGFGVELDEGGDVRFLRTDGRLVPEVPPPALPVDSPAALERKHARREVRPGPWTATPEWNGEALDLGYAIEVLWTR